MWKRLAALLAASVLTLSPSVAEENASNPLSRVKNTDVRAQYFDNPDGSYRWDLWLVDGAFMATDKLTTVRSGDVGADSPNEKPIFGLPHAATMPFPGSRS